MVLMVMLCSSLVVNVKSNLTETDLDRLACFCRMAKMIHGEKETVRSDYLQVKLERVPVNATHCLSRLRLKLPSCHWH
jgi:hypothetical protein